MQALDSVVVRFGQHWPAGPLMQPHSGADTEVRLVEGLARGRQAKVLAAELGLSASSFSYRVRRIVRRLGLSSTHALLKVVADSALTRALPISELTPAEVEVLHAVRAGLSNGQIAQVRGRSDRTVANQVAAILRKTGASGRRALVVGLLLNPSAASPDLSSGNAPRFD